MSTQSPRRFKVEPVDTTVRLSKRNIQDKPEALPLRRKFVPEPIETSVKSSRRFAPELVETINKTNRPLTAKHNEPTMEQHVKKDAVEASNQRVRRFNVEPVETTYISSQKRNSSDSLSSKTEEAQKRPARKFAPLLIETATRSRKAGDANPAILPSDKTEAIPGEKWKDYRKTGVLAPPPANSPIVEKSQNPLFLEMKRAASPLARCRQGSFSSMRSHHSFRVPELEPIESSESEPSAPPSPSTSPSASSDPSSMFKEATCMRENVDDRYSRYLLGSAARAAERQLQEQAMAAFPNNDFHEPVDHFIDRDSDEASYSEDAKRPNESSFEVINWELLAMQEHQAKREKEEAEQEKKRGRDAEEKKKTKKNESPWGNAAYLMARTRNATPKDREMDQMRKSARPPMLGEDITFPRCSSPEPARFDPTQGCDAMRNAMCYLTQQSQISENGEKEALWCGRNAPSTQPSMWSRANSRSPSKGGLWAGSCVNTGTTPPRGPSGLLTPSIEIKNPLSPCSTPAVSCLPPTPPASAADFAGVDKKLAQALAIQEEFGDDFVTQVYNYLSLGYPSIAREFDGELSRISLIPIKDLRQDDQLVSSTGYIRLGEDGYLKTVEVTEESCVRWRALRIYIREWAKQQPGMVGDSSPAGIGGTSIGIAVRRGSWAI
ncbi:hypothetical protein P154DRAFT_548268 [Amniculicola lignicola CBS 123094]|uniref:Uncharacterized protein n=1 Tax=Amniculicola lignicola CBS 123094 TaxID=1392246 RepID=A0A6A5W2D1_9PLEO|nr:hypothetical protein P154DRAFT_548268 [Amniculicola lignicola CBS 123094]